MLFFGDKKSTICSMNNFRLNVKYVGLVVRDTIMYIWFIPDLLYAII